MLSDPDLDGTTDGGVACSRATVTRSQDAISLADQLLRTRDLKVGTWETVDVS